MRLSQRDIKKFQVYLVLGYIEPYKIISEACWQNSIEAYIRFWLGGATEVWSLRPNTLIKWVFSNNINNNKHIWEVFFIMRF